MIDLFQSTVVIEEVKYANLDFFNGGNGLIIEYSLIVFIIIITDHRGTLSKQPFLGFT